MRRAPGCPPRRWRRRVRSRPRRSRRIRRPRRPATTSETSSATGQVDAACRRGQTGRAPAREDQRRQPPRKPAGASGRQARGRRPKRTAAKARRAASARRIRRRRPASCRRPVHRDAAGRGARQRDARQLLGWRLDDHRAGSRTARGRAPPARRAGRGVRHLLRRDGDRLAARGPSASTSSTVCIRRGIAIACASRPRPASTSRCRR